MPAERMAEPEVFGLRELGAAFRQYRWWLTLAPLSAGALALGVTFLITPTFTAKTTFLPPQQQQSGAASALANLGALAGIAGVATGGKNSAEQYAALMQSVTIEDRLIDRFKLMDAYGEQLRVDARKELERNVRIGIGKKDGLISVEVDDVDKVRAAALANAHVEELRRLVGGLAMSEAQQRRVFFETQLQQTRSRLTEAQLALQASGFNAAALKAEPKAAAEGYAGLRSEAVATEIRLQTLRRSLADNTPEVQVQQAHLEALRAQLARVEQSSVNPQGPDYIGRYREFKYQETLFDLFARQYELARVDEAREGALIQVIDTATPPDRKSKPRRGVISAASAIGAFIALFAIVSIRCGLGRRSVFAPTGE